jgi:hypothetical protein
MGKGARYEEEVCTLVESELNMGNLGIDPTLARMKKKPSYFSRDRNREITFDISVEVRRKGLVDPFWIWIWECKNYNHSVPVDDVEEFHAKLSQVGADRTKGTMITPHGFDSGGVEFARSKGIGLWRWIPNGSLVSLMEDSRRPSEVDVLRALTITNTAGFRSYSDFYCLTCDGRFVIDKKEMIAIEFADAK